jgi:hypothetical protein
LSREKISETVWIIESSSAGESHPHALPEPDVNLSALPTLIDQEKEARGGQLPGSYLIMTILPKPNLIRFPGRILICSAYQKELLHEETIRNF